MNNNFNLPYAVRALVYHRFDDSILKVQVVFNCPMDKNVRPDESIWELKIDNAEEPIVSSIWIDEYTLELQTDTLPNAPNDVTLALLQPTQYLKTTWDKQWEPFGAIFSQPNPPTHNLTGTANQIILDNDGVGVLNNTNINLSLPQDIDTNASPEFAGITSPIVNGGKSASNNLTIRSTSHATKGKILFGTSAYDEANDKLGIGIANPNYKLEIIDNNNAGSGLKVQNNSAGVSAASRIICFNNRSALSSYFLAQSYSSGCTIAYDGITLADFGAMGTAGSDSKGLLLYAAGNFPLFLGTNSKIRAKIAGDGKASIYGYLGVGSANTPANALDVAGEINATAGYKINGTAGATGTFTTADGKTVTVTNGLITSIV